MTIEEAAAEQNNLFDTIEALWRDSASLGKACELLVQEQEEAAGGAADEVAALEGAAEAIQEEED